jgi:two-component system response regulator LytT
MSKGRILVVEDELIIADNLCFTLEAFGYEVGEPAASYYEAIDMIEEQVPHLAILDVQLASKKSGIDLAKVILDKYDFPFIFLTSNGDKMTFDEAKQFEPSAYLVKPYGKEELLFFPQKEYFFLFPKMPS